MCKDFTGRTKDVCEQGVGHHFKNLLYNYCNKKMFPPPFFLNVSFSKHLYFNMYEMGGVQTLLFRYNTYGWI